jgi:hypothetical protein
MSMSAVRVASKLRRGTVRLRLGLRLLLLRLRLCGTGLLYRQAAHNLFYALRLLRIAQGGRNFSVAVDGTA